MGTKPPAAIDERISKDGRHGLGAASPLSTTTSSLQGRAGGSAFTPKRVELVFGPCSTQRAGKPSPRNACTAVAAPSVRSRVLVFTGPSASMARRGCRAPCYRLVTCWSITLVSSEISSSFLFYRSKQLSIPSKKLSILFYCSSNLSSKSRYTSASVGSSDPNSSCWETGPFTSGTA